MSILIGGWTSNGPMSSKTYFYNHIDNTWTAGPFLINGRHSHTAGIVKDHMTQKEHIVVVGGAGAEDSVEIMFDGENDWISGILNCGRGWSNPFDSK